jgi:hypothetical protein
MGSVSKIAATSIPCSQEITYHASFGKDKALRLWIGNTEYLKWSDKSALSGAAGIGGSGMPAGNSISYVQLGRLAPAPIPAQPLNAYVTGSPGEGGFVVNVRAFLDDFGPGIVYYHWYRNGVYLTSTLLPRILDNNVPSLGEYSYTVQAEDFHGNLSPMVKVANPINESLSPMLQSNPACPLGQIYDEDNYYSDGSGPFVPPVLCILPGALDPPEPSDNVKPLPACMIEAHFRNLATQGGFLAGHGYLTIYSTYTHVTRIVEGYEDVDQYLVAWNSSIGIPADNPSTDAVVGSVPTSTKACIYWSTYLKPAVDKINGADIVYFLNGPNSNSVMRYLTSILPGFQGGGVLVWPPLRAVGFNAELPGVE